MKKVRVGVHGYGVIGKRIADAVILQDDMELVGVTARTPDFRLLPAVKKNITIYGSDEEHRQQIEQAGIKTAGSLPDLVKVIDVIIDATPKGVGAQNKEFYEQSGIKAIFEGGESHDLTGLSFVAQVNYSKAAHANSVRVVSCNTTAITRMLSGFMSQNLVQDVFVVINRRGADPVDANEQGPLGTINVGEIPSHHGTDVKTVLPGVVITSVAQEVPTTLGHLHTLKLMFTQELSREEVIAILHATPRTIPVFYSQGITSENKLTELMRDLGNPRADMWEVAYWEDTMMLNGRELIINYQVHNEAIVVPENIDAIRAITGLETQASVSMENTDTYLSTNWLDD